MPSQEPSSDLRNEEVDVPPDDTEDEDRSETLSLFNQEQEISLVLN